MQARERSAAQSAQVQGGRQPPKEQSTGAALLTGDAATPKCCFCQQEHPSRGCKTVVDIEARRAVIRRTGRCFVCLRKGHISQNCHSKIKCQACKGRHHVAVCPGPSVTEQPSPSNTPALNPRAQSYHILLLLPQLCRRIPVTRCYCRQCELR